MYKYVRNGIVFTQNEINKMGIKNPTSIGFTVVQDIIPEHDSYSEKVIRTEEVVDGKYVYNIIPLTKEEKIKLVTSASNDILEYVDRYLDLAVVEIKKYDSKDAIGKYLVESNPFYEEAVKISLWIGNTYKLCSEIMEDIIENDRAIPTLEEIILSIPRPEFLTLEEKETMREMWDNGKYIFKQKYTNGGV